MRLNGRIKMTIERKGGLFRSEHRCYTMTLSIGNKTSAQPAYVIVAGKIQEYEDSAIKQIGTSLLLSDILMTTIDKENCRLELHDLITKGLDNAFIVNYLFVNARQSADRFSTPDESPVHFSSFNQEKVLLMFHRMDLKKIRFFLEGGETKVVSYRHMMQDERQPPLLGMIKA